MVCEQSESWCVKSSVDRTFGWNAASWVWKLQHCDLVCVLDLAITPSTIDEVTGTEVNVTLISTMFVQTMVTTLGVLLSKQIKDTDNGFL